MTGTGSRRTTGRHRTPTTNRPLAAVTPLRSRSGSQAGAAGRRPTESRQVQASRGGTRGGHKTRPKAGASDSTVAGRGLALTLGAVVTLACAVGIIMVLSSSAAAAQAEFGNPWYHLQRQAMWLAMGVVGLVVAVRLDLMWARRLIRPAMWGSIGLLVLVLLPFAGQTVNGASRWLELGPITLQPSEFIKLTLALFVADLLASRADRMWDTSVTVRPVLVVTAVCCALIMLQPNLGTTVLVATMVMVVLWVAGARGPLLAGLGLGGVALAVGLAITEPYRFARLTAFVDPWADPLGGGYQTLQSQAAIANGGLTGLGLGQGRSKFGFLPEGHTDFIFSNISEEFGLIGSLLTIGLFVAIAVLGGMIALRAPDRFGMLLAAGITTWVTLQAVVNLGVTVGVLPITGVPLPLVSAGGSSLVVTMVACGLLMNVARRAS